jgi:hypothetical protein
MNEPLRPFGWKYDLSSPNTPASPGSITNLLQPAPNLIHENYIELSRTTVNHRGFSSIAGSLLLIAGLLMIMYFIHLDLLYPTNSDLKATAIITLLYIATAFITLPYIRLDIQHPRDAPIRFNRHCRKAYFYEYRFDRLRPLGRKHWGIKPIAYNWDDLTAEVYSVYAPMGYGGLVEKVMIAVRKPGSDEVIDRLLFADNLEKGKQYWEISKLFMQEGAESLPEFTFPPTDWSIDPFNPMERLAPKVQWPAEMDLESRTAPSHEEQLP